MLRTIPFLLLLFFIILALLLGTGIGIGYLLHWLIPAIGLDFGSLIGVVSLVFALQFLSQLLQGVSDLQQEDGELDPADVETIFLTPIRPRRPRKGRKK